MSGETDLARLLATMAPRRDPVPYAFRTLAAGETVPADAIGTFREDEGLSIVAPAKAGETAFARLTLTVHSSLEAVGLTAAVSTALTGHGISANVVAAAFHDHVFVPWGRADDAMAALAALAQPPSE